MCVPERHGERAHSCSTAPGDTEQGPVSCARESHPLDSSAGGLAGGRSVWALSEMPWAESSVLGGIRTVNEQVCAPGAHRSPGLLTLSFR